MQKPTHINIGYSTLLSSMYFLGIFNSIFILAPFLFILADADHGQDSLSKKGLSLPGKHRGWSHSIFGASILTFFVSLLYILVYYISTNISNTSYNIQHIIYTIIMIIFLSLVISLIGNILFKVFNIKSLKNIIAGIILVWYIILLLLIGTGHINLPLGFNPDIIVILIDILILSHIIGDYFTVSGIPVLYPFSKEKYRMPVFYVSTGTNGEKIVNMLFVIINLIIIFLIYKNNKISEILVNNNHIDSLTSLGLLIISWLVIIYFLGKDIGYKNIKKNSKEIFSSLFKLLLLVVSMFLLLSMIIIGLNYIFNNNGQTIYILTLLLGLLAIYIIYLFSKKILKEITDITSSIVYIIIMLIQLFITILVLYLFLYK